MVLIAGLGLLTTAGVTAAVLSNNHKKTSAKETSKKECTYKKDCASKKECSKTKTACYY